MPAVLPWKPWIIPADISVLGAWVGTGGFDFPEGAGQFYPPMINGGGKSGRKAQEGFPFYQQYFSFLEIGHTFYQEPQLQQFLELERRSKSSLRFSVKVHGDISHKSIWDPEQGKALMRKHVTAVSPIHESGRLHSFLIQLDEGLERNRKVLDYLLATSSTAISEGMDVHIEFRNRTWHQESVLQALKDAGVGICNTEIPGLTEAFPLKAYATSKKGYIRYHGLNLDAWHAAAQTGSGCSPIQRQQISLARYDYLYSEKELAARLRGQLQLLRKVGATAIVFNNQMRANSARNAIQAIQLLRDKLDPR